MCQYVEGVELLLEHEERLWSSQQLGPGSPHSWECLDPVRAAYTPDITPLVIPSTVHGVHTLNWCDAGAGRAQEQLRDPEDPAGPRLLPAAAARRQVRLRPVRRVQPQGQPQVLTRSR